MFSTWKNVPLLSAETCGLKTNLVQYTEILRLLYHDKTVMCHNPTLNNPWNTFPFLLDKMYTNPVDFDKMTNTWKCETSLLSFLMTLCPFQFHTCHDTSWPFKFTRCESEMDRGTQSEWQSLWQINLIKWYIFYISLESVHKAT